MNYVLHIMKIHWSTLTLRNSGIKSGFTSSYQVEKKRKTQHLDQQVTGNSSQRKPNVKNKKAEERADI